MALEQGSLLQRSGLEQLWAIVPDMTSESWRPMDSEFKLIRKRLFTTGNANRTRGTRENPVNLSSGKVRHDVRHEELPGLFNVPIVID